MSVPLHLENSNSMTAWWWKEAVWLWLLTPSDWLTSARLDSLLNYDLFWRQQMWLKFSKQWPGRNITEDLKYSIFVITVSIKVSLAENNPGHSPLIIESFLTASRQRDVPGEKRAGLTGQLKQTYMWHCGEDVEHQLLKLIYHDNSFITLVNKIIQFSLCVSLTNQFMITRSS